MNAPAPSPTDPQERTRAEVEKMREAAANTARKLGRGLNGNAIAAAILALPIEGTSR